MLLLRNAILEVILADCPGRGFGLTVHLLLLDKFFLFVSFLHDRERQKPQILHKNKKFCGIYTWYDR